MRHYDINSFDLLHSMIRDLGDDPSQDWSTYPCLEWPRARSNYGYGKVWDANTKKLLDAHRLSYEAAYGLLEEGSCALHRCDNPPCFRPIHLFSGTKGDNRKDCVAKGRDNRIDRARGRDNPMVKLYPEQVLEIRHLFAEGANKCELMRKFKVSHRLIFNIIKRTAWKHI